MIRGLHGLLYSSEPEATRAFIRDKLKLVYSDLGEGWLIFDLPEADIGVHPTDERGQPPSGTHEVSFYCDDIHGTVAELRARGVQFDHGVDDREYGLVTSFTMPGGVQVLLYEPKYRKHAPKRRAASRSAGAEQTGKHSKTFAERRRR